MTLKLVMIRCPDHMAPEQRKVHGGEFSIGRGPGNEWIIPDPERHLSKQHCRFAYRAGAWEITDLSANGTFLNRAPTPIGPGAPQVLRTGDRIAFGAFELEVTIEEDGAGYDRGAPIGGYAPRPSSDLDPFAAPAPYAPGADFARQDDLHLSDGEPGSGIPKAPILPADFDPLAPIEEAFRGPTQSDHAPALDSAFRPPKPIALIPDDWDASLPTNPQPQARTMAQPSVAPAVPTPMPREIAAPAAVPAPGPAPVLGQGNLLAAFLRGAGLEVALPDDPERTMERIGAALRAAVSGIRQALIARASVKDTFRIEQTMIQATGNNPLKFSVDDDDALITLMGLGRRGSLPADVAMTDALLDMRLHELATSAAMQAAVRKLLEQFDPGTIEHSAGSNALNILPAQRRARAWDAFTHLHRQVTQALSDDFDSVFGKAFARAYEQAIEELSARETTP